MIKITLKTDAIKHSNLKMLSIKTKRGFYFLSKISHKTLRISSIPRLTTDQLLLIPVTIRKGPGFADYRKNIY